MITEADARVLDIGSTIILVGGGHITPLAQDTLKARRVSVVREGTDPDAADLAPVATSPRFVPLRYRATTRRSH
jgi:hypothetical protein